MNILILGISGMLGNILFKYLTSLKRHEVFGTIRNLEDKKFFTNIDNKKINILDNINKFENISNLFKKIKPDLVINCIGVIKQKKEILIPSETIKVNSLFPHQVNQVCSDFNVRFIQFSTDCVFSGSRGNYIEDDIPDCSDFYGRSKLLGEINHSPNSITLRTSIIGTELKGNASLLDWFLSQSNQVLGYKNAIFSGFTTLEISKIINNVIIPNPKLSGIYHLASEPINKFSLLSIVKKIFKKRILIIPDYNLSINRSLNSEKFFLQTKYIAPSWMEMIADLYNYKKHD